MKHEKACFSKVEENEDTRIKDAFAPWNIAKGQSCDAVCPPDIR